MSTHSKNKQKQSVFKSIAHWLHLWLGIICAISLFSLCITGTIFVFHNEVDHWINPEIYKVDSQGLNAKTPEELRIIVEKSSNGKVVNLLIPSASDESWQLGVQMPDKKEAKSHERQEAKPSFYIVNQYNGKILSAGKITQTAKFFKSVQNIHRWFFFDKAIGRPITGVAVSGFILITISGFIIWLPKKLKYLKEACSIKWKGSQWKRINFDMHRAFGFYVIPIILLCAVTGLCWSFENWDKGMSKLAGNKMFLYKGYKTQKLTTTAADSVYKPLSPILYKINSLQNDNASILLDLPKKKEAPIVATIVHQSFWSGAIDRLEINPYNGEIIKADFFKDKSLREQFAIATKAIHVGEIWGSFSKWLYFLTALLASSLPITGILIYINKWKKSRKRKN